MATIILSGVGGSTNWLPLILPLLAIVLILQFSETIIHFFKRKRWSHQHHLGEESNSFPDESGGQNIE